MYSWSIWCKVGRVVLRSAHPEPGVTAEFTLANSTPFSSVGFPENRGQSAVFNSTTFEIDTRKEHSDPVVSPAPIPTKPNNPDMKMASTHG